jgi:hypothetical protein
MYIVALHEVQVQEQVAFGVQLRQQRINDIEGFHHLDGFARLNRVYYILGFFFALGVFRLKRGDIRRLFGVQRDKLLPFVVGQKLGGAGACFFNYDVAVAVLDYVIEQFRVKARFGFCYQNAVRETDVFR